MRTNQQARRLMSANLEIFEGFLEARDQGGRVSQDVGQRGCQEGPAARQSRPAAARTRCVRRRRSLFHGSEARSEDDVARSVGGRTPACSRRGASSFAGVLASARGGSRETRRGLVHRGKAKKRFWQRLQVGIRRTETEVKDAQISQVLFEYRRFRT